MNAQDKSGSRAVTVGQGEYIYSCEHDWAMQALPADHHYGGASHGVAISSDGTIFITHPGTPGSIFVFDPAGKFIRAMGEIHKGQGHGIDIRQEGDEEFIYLAPSNPQLAFTKMTLQGEVLWQKDLATISKNAGGILDQPNTSFRPTNCSFRPDGGYYLGDGYCSNYVFEYDKTDNYVRTLGGPARPHYFAECQQ